MNQTELLDLHAALVIQAKGNPYDKIVKTANKKLQSVLGRFEAGKIEKDSFIEKAQRHLTKAYEKSFMKGAGRNKINAKGQAWLEEFKASQFKYLEGFADAIENGSTIMGTSQRMGMYANAIRSSYWSGSVLGSKSSALFDWITNPGENCEDCLEREDNNSYRRDELPGVPGDGSTICGSNCNCMIVRHE